MISFCIFYLFYIFILLTVHRFLSLFETRLAPYVDGLPFILRALLIFEQMLKRHIKVGPQLNARMVSFSIYVLGKHT